MGQLSSGVHRALTTAFAFALLVSPGCQDYELEGDDDTTPMGDDDTTPPDDDDSTPPDDDDTTPPDDDDTTGDSPCDDPEWPDLSVPIDDSCTLDPGQATWDIHLAWSYSGPTNCYAQHIGRMIDANGDGVVDSADPMQMWSDGSMYTGAELVTHDGTQLHHVLVDARVVLSTIGDVDPTYPGMEYLATYTLQGDDFEYLAMYSGDTEIWFTWLQDDQAVQPWLTDLEGDGSREILVGALIVDAHTGTLLGELEGMPTTNTELAIAADLDLDGAREIIAATAYSYQDVGLFAADGSLIDVCWHSPLHWSYTAYAVGNLDGDPEGEFVAAGRHGIALCDSDGSLLQFADHGMHEPLQAGLAELDGDAEVEIVLADDTGVSTFHHDLTLLWRWESTVPDIGHYPFVVADMDGDGIHEILVRVYTELVILGGDGSVVTEVPAYDCNCASDYGAPSVVDVDADGLAEIVVPAWPTFAVLENDYGGWAVESSDEPWPFLDKFPGDRTPEGAVPAPVQPHWTIPGHNVWQGLPQGTSTLLPQPDLAIESIDVCADEEAGQTWITAYVANQGALQTHASVVVFLRSLPNLVFVDEQVVQPPLMPGIATAVQFVVPSEDVADGFEITADELDAVPECDEADNSAIWMP